MKVALEVKYGHRVPFDMGGTDGVCRDELDFSGLPVRARLHRCGCRWLRIDRHLSAQRRQDWRQGFLASLHLAAAFAPEVAFELFFGDLQAPFH